MNLILVRDSDFIDARRQRVRLHGRRHQHILAVHRAQPEDELSVGELNGLMGTGRITELTAGHVELEVSLKHSPPPPLPVTLLLALPRPKMLKRTLQTIAAMGVKNIVLLNSYRVEKSYWQTPFLKPAAIEENLILGLEQAKDTVLPEVVLKKRFKPFVEDELPTLIENSRALLAHPGLGTECPHNLAEPTTLAIGPEGGFIQYEVDKLLAAGFEGIHLGPRILKVETAVPALLSKLF